MWSLHPGLEAVFSERQRSTKLFMLLMAASGWEQAICASACKKCVCVCVCVCVALPYLQLILNVMIYSQKESKRDQTHTLTLEWLQPTVSRRHNTLVSEVSSMCVCVSARACVCDSWCLKLGAAKVKPPEEMERCWAEHTHKMPRATASALYL